MAAATTMMSHMSSFAMIVSLSLDEGLLSFLDHDHGIGVSPLDLLI